MRRIFFIMACIVIGESVAAVVEWLTFRGWEHFPQPGTIMAAVYMPFGAMMAYQTMRRRPR